MLKKHFVEFSSPGTIVAEVTSKPIESWDVEKAVKMADEIVERHGATPHSFCFTTRGRGENDLDSKELERSCRYILGGEILTVEDVEKITEFDTKILLSNMRGNGWDRVVLNKNSYRHILPYRENDVVLDYTPPRDRKEEPTT